MTTKKIILLTCLTMFCSLLPAEAQWVREYTEERPLIIVSDWEFPPYEFRNDDGEADGYNVEVLDLILNTLKVPHKYVMQEWYLCTKTFENREADLIHALTINYRKHPYVMTQNMITYYPVKLVRRKSQKAIHRLSELTAKDTLMVKNNDYVALRIQEIQDKPFHTEYRSPREALSAIRNGHGTYYVWGEMPLKMKIREYGLDSLLLDDIDIPAGELRIIGYDKELIDAIDDTYARLEQSGELQPIHDKWFNPERTHNDSSPIALFALIGSVIAIIIAFLLSQLIHSRIKTTAVRSEDINSMMKQALQMGNFYVFEYDIKANHMRNTHGMLIPDEGLSLEDFIKRLDPDIQQDFEHHTHSLMAGQKQNRYFNRRFNIGSEEAPDWRQLEGTAIVEQEDGKPRYIVYAVKDITIDVESERINQEMGNKYARMFETNLIAMSFYDKEGFLIDVNEKMRHNSVSLTRKARRSSVRPACLISPCFMVPMIMDPVIPYISAVTCITPKSGLTSISRSGSDPFSMRRVSCTPMWSPHVTSRQNGRCISRRSTMTSRSARPMMPSMSMSISSPTCWRTVRCSSGAPTSRHVC